MKVVKTFKLPIIMKPSYRDPLYDKSFKKAYKIEDFENTESQLEKILPIHNSVIIQEFIPGGDNSIFFCLLVMDTNQNLIASYTGQKSCVWPPVVGGTAACIPAAEHHDELTELSLKLLTAAKYQGMAGVEFKRDHNNGQFYLIEPTVGRTDYQAEIACLNGVNLPFAYHCMLNNIDYQTQHITTDKGWKDPMAAYSGANISQVHPGIKMLSSLFRWHDPMPAVSFLYARVKNKISSMTRTR